jgi:hypothetical protein
VRAGPHNGGGVRWPDASFWPSGSPAGAKAP